jgi:hypothetical protein
MANQFDAFFRDNTGLFIPTTNVWDLYFVESLTKDEQLRNVLVKLYENMNQIALALNKKDSGIFVELEFVNGQTFTNDDIQVFRKLIVCGSLPDSSTKRIPHYIDFGNSYSFTKIYGCATNPIDLFGIPLPYASATSVKNIELYVDQNDVVITTSATYSQYTTTYVVLEYIKQ